MFLCDGATAYNKLIDAKKCQKIVLITHKDNNKACHLNTINDLHSRLKAMLRYYRGVSSKYLNRYLARFTALEQAGCSVFYPEIDPVRQMSPSRIPSGVFESSLLRQYWHFDGQAQMV